MKTILSSLSSDVSYVRYDKGENGKLIPKGEITVKGGAYVADPRLLMMIPAVATTITDEALEQLQENPIFKRQIAKGHLKIVTEEPRNLDAASSDLEKDKSAQVTDSDYKKSGKSAPKTGKGA